MTLAKLPEFLKTDCYVGGGWVSAGSDARFDVLDPANGEVLASVPRMGEADTDNAIAAAQDAYEGWSNRTAADRARVLNAWAAAMRENAEELARLMTLEQGKPLSEARVEVEYAASFFSWFAEEGRRLYGDIIPPHRTDARILVTRNSLGVVGGITPWNFPSAMVTRKAAPALAAGNCMVLKPAEATPLSALAIAALGEQVGVPAGVFNVVTGDREDAPLIGKALIDNPAVRKIGFTGSTAVGKQLMRDCAGDLTKVSLELGGNAAFIVFDDADIEAALEGVQICKFRNAGQTCIAANRILVQDSIHDKFVAALCAKASEIEIGHGLEDGVSQGPLIDTRGLEKVERLVADATDKGAKLHLGGQRHAAGGTHYQPTVMTGVTPAMDIAHQEVFGPVAAISSFKDEAEAIAMANDTPYGLAGYFYSRDVGRIFRVADALKTGIVGVNTGLISTEVAPFGGVKESGIGREGSKYGIEDWTELKYICLAGLGRAS
ncbi:NAD-dependent succinate-semialdehyde dehydrogenase [Ruegeria meonggei]|uniref:Glutarate-semialdehyde dehydrogenase DavD n=1 Tax=Ruegeria meonggei TaxID=1446476 RepID=A0A1X7A0C4_9RHOB|nr:NAD-dependent succinate-semialdehyde dehydrogenase [Ruegeria meonggei]SLN67076.1 Glutarate-semialdehyde dehydrogenase DavD [Ruegeria meonggei]